ncbi:MAG TPA: hypothetical protein VHG53_05370 [Candidatus Limnocylindria bacterium]|nr:hypothetical protein [Candidatus Limnocylindria bacterium]
MRRSTRSPPIRRGGRRSGRRASATSSTSWIRTCSILPYDLGFELERTVAEPQAGILEARLTGDLEGLIRWSIEPTDDGCLITFDEQVVTNKAAPNALAPLARPAFGANHALMMATVRRVCARSSPASALGRKFKPPD